MPVSNSQQVDVLITSGSEFGRYSKIDASKTINMFVSDGWLVNYPGFKKIKPILPFGEGRGLFNSIRGGFLLVVIDAQVFRIDPNLNLTLIGVLNTTVGDVYIDENLASQICIVDGTDAYIYNWTLPPNLTAQVLNIPLFPPLSPFIQRPGYVCYHNSFFLFGSHPNSPNPQVWSAWEPDTNTTIKHNSTFLLQTKPDKALAVERLPGKGNNVLVLGSTVAEVWQQVGGTENYRRVSSYNIDNGTVAVSTIASNEEQICWLAQNENNAPFIMISNGSATQRISTDGIDHVLDQIQFPAESDAFFYRQDGHLFYQITFYNPLDNLSLVYDFSTQKFFHVTDQNLNYHPARSIAFFNEKTYFVSIKDGSLYETSSDLLTYDYDTSLASVGEEIPRIRICNTVRLPDSSRFRPWEFVFWIEQGMTNVNPSIQPQVDLSFSKDGGVTFGTVVSKKLNPVGVRRNQMRYFNFGQCNELTIKIQFLGFTRMVVNNGRLSIGQ